MGTKIEVVKCDYEGSYDKNGKYWRITFIVEESPEVAKQIFEQVLINGKDAWQKMAKGNSDLKKVRFIFYGDGLVCVISGELLSCNHWEGSELYKKPAFKSIIKKVDNICNTNAHEQMIPDSRDTNN